MTDKMVVQNMNGTTIPHLIWRFFTGQHLDGWERMNTSWLRRGTTPAHKSNWWNKKARLERAAWRHAIFWLFCANVYGLLVARTLTLICMALGLAYLAIKLVIGVHGKVFKPIRVGYGDFEVIEKMVHPHLSQKWERFKSFFIQSYNATDDSANLPPEVLKALQAEAAEDGEAPIISAELVTVKGDKK